MIVAELIEILSKFESTAEVAIAWDGSLSDPGPIGLDDKGAVIIDAGEYMSFDDRRDRTAGK